MKRPDLRAIPLDIQECLKGGAIVITMSVGQWDQVLAGAYDAGFVLLELNENDEPIASYRKFEIDPKNLQDPYVRKGHEILNALRAVAAANNLPEEEFDSYERFVEVCMFNGMLRGVKWPTPDVLAKTCYDGYMLRKLWEAPSASERVM